MNIKEEALKKHYEWHGKIEVISRAPIETREDLSLAYTPGVAEACLAIKDDPSLSYSLTRRKNLVAVITDGTAVLGLGDIGGLAGMPVMEGKCCLFKEFADVDAFPLCVKSKNVDEIVRTIELLSDSFGGINLEDISAPRCFEIERRLKEKLDIPVFHDDQHGTAVVVAAAMINAAKCAGKKLSEMTVVINGAGAAGIAIGTFLLKLGIGDLIMVDLCGIINRDTKYENSAHNEIKSVSNKNVRKGSLADAMKGADAFVGVSRPGLVTAEMIQSMAERPIVFAMANPTPEIMPDEAKAAGAFIVGTGRSDFPNQINNVLVFPGLFKGALSVRAKAITEEMKIAAAHAIAAIIPESELSAENIIPSPLDKAVAKSVAEAVAKAWTENQ
ncbi:MAG: NADP-dependent malic enzyme [Bacteroides sp.]|nr:NADP-dependent malic enzyme [Eubacterium sp.]MCM1417162.1 NADP-dependent malic enzyme [Roseburia sp.]MCM1461217.1 NADP-dependent malic enzyme [Bacteroides sp.]